MTQSHFTIDDIRFGTDDATYERAVGLYESAKVTNVLDDGIGYEATVIGTHPYHVYVHAKHYDRGTCDCYMGKQDVYCKHMVALAIYAVAQGRPLTPEETANADDMSCSDTLGVLTPAELKAVKAEISMAMRYIKPYNGPSRTWFAYQDSLSQGVRRLSAIVSKLPVSKQTATLLIALLLRLDKKLCDGVDDSDGTVGGFMQETANILEQFARLDPSCIRAFEKIVSQDRCFDWDTRLMRILDEGLDSLDSSD